MDNGSDQMVAAMLAAAIVGTMQFADSNEGMREAVRLYRSLSRRVRRIHDEDERAQLLPGDHPNSI